MSESLLKLAEQFVSEHVLAMEFVNSFQDRWKVERDSGIGDEDPSALSETLSTIFCITDLYNPDADRYDYELDDSSLREKVLEVLNNRIGDGNR